MYSPIIVENIDKEFFEEVTGLSVDGVEQHKIFWDNFHYYSGKIHLERVATGKEKK